MSINETGYFGPNEPLSYENALCIVSKVNAIIKRYDSYDLPVS